MYSLIRTNKRIVAMAVAVFIIPLAVFAYTSPGKPTGFVNDFAGMLAPSEIEGINAKLSAFEKKTGDEIAVVTVPNLGGDTVENFAVEFFKEWSIGKKNKDNGILLLISRDDREMRIEVGYGLEGMLTDAESFWILNKELAPAFRDGKYYDGVSAAVDKIMFAVEGEIPIPFEDAQIRSGPSFDFIWIVFFVLLWISSILARSKSWWAGGVVGGVAGVIIGIIKGFLYVGIISLVILIPLGLIFDFLVSRAYQKSKKDGGVPPWWIGGGRHGGGGFGGGGFGSGGFGGGSSGGGGASSRW
ncbi:MAG: TPM domain-containing protein [Candidatus Jorgensenbacteria bacterium]|nr:TPM domain-containing protein [Candidatus Jorgensenbacteria bacterium]